VTKASPGGSSAFRQLDFPDGPSKPGPRATSPPRLYHIDPWRVILAGQASPGRSSAVLRL
jgi:hypothetical protein